ncbi:MAG TPA: hypothetical protein PLH27_00245 [bacterium]|nr:hypothetical protein [bacterium]HMZ03252.1 hypothetical protein [bacterium]HNB08129.1 hypothetical protein [bacterium]HNB56072.1 hypothetical protein [bacterium]HNC47386.1 hypothetical protein [bacterium]
MKYHVVVFLFFLAISCSCGDPEREDSPYLERDYVYITGILVPDSFRAYRQEVFVGKMLDIKIGSEEVDTTHYGEDPLLYIQNLVTWHDYRGKLVGTSGATVFIRDQYGTEVQLLDIGNGFYQDVANELKIKSMITYTLIVTIGNDTSEATTTVPGNFQLSNVTDGDTVDVTVRPYRNTYGGDFFPYWSLSNSTFFYRTLRSTSLFPPIILKHIYSPPSVIPLIIDTTEVSIDTVVASWIEVTSLDSNYGKMYSPEQTSTGPTDLLTYLSDQETTSLSKRTNIKGRNVAGVFGSLNRTKRVNFYMKAVKQ